MGLFSSRPTPFQHELLDLLEEMRDALVESNTIAEGFLKIGMEQITLMRKLYGVPTPTPPATPLVDFVAEPSRPKKPAAKKPAKKVDPEFYTFDECLAALNIDENRLKRLVSEGEVRAFREGDQMKFKKGEIDKLLQLKHNA